MVEFVDKHFNTFHLFHAPHKWFLALLISPIHAAEIHYKNRYHLNFIHAKKLFFFDLLLIAFIFVLIGLSIFWFKYDPTVTKLVDLSIQTIAPTERIKSGDKITYVIEYANKSESKLVDVQMSLQLPHSFIFESAEPADLFNPETKTFSVGELSPGSAGRLSLTGFFYGHVGHEYHVLTTLSYTQEHREIREQKLGNTVTVLRDSVLVAELTAPNAILSHSEVPVTLRLKNESEHTLNNVAVTFNKTDNYSFSFPSRPSTGSLDGPAWVIESLYPGQEAFFDFLIVWQVTSAEPTSYFTLTPTIRMNGEDLEQKPIQKTFAVVRPEATVSAVWADNITSLHPGSSAVMIVNIENNGNTELTDLTIELPVPNNIIDTARLTAVNHGRYRNGLFTIDSTFVSNFKKLLPGESTSIEINIPILYRVYDITNATLTLVPTFSASVPQAALSRYRRETTAPQIKIGTNLFLTAEAKYYTDEGDQLGRGPLPPKVGEETKYWVIVTLQNTTSKLTNVNFSAQLPDYIDWTGRSSVNHGADLVYNEKTHMVSWSLNSMDADHLNGLYMELSFTPSASQVGQTPTLLQNIRVSAKDEYTGFDLDRSVANVSTALVGDTRAQARGTVVVQ